MGEIVKQILSVISNALQIPTIIILILLILLTILMLGSFVAEIFTERKALKMNIPGLVDQLQGKDSTQMKEAIEASGLLNRQKESARELINRTSYNDDTREALARQLIADEDMRYNKIVKITDLVARVAPMFGLMGTLIPLGPGLEALGNGDMTALSQSLLIAFNTTVAGLISGAVSYVISGIRKGWYEEYMIGLETVMETILDVQSDERSAAGYKPEPVNGGTNDKGTETPSIPGSTPAPIGSVPTAGAQPGAPGMSGVTPVQARHAQPAVPQRPAQPAVPQRPAQAAAPVRPQAAQPVQPKPVQPAAPSRPAPARPAAPAAPEVMSKPDNVQEIKAQDVVSEIDSLVGGTPQQARPQVGQQGAVSSRRETLTQPVQSQAVRPDSPQMSRNTQTQPHAAPDSKMEHTMVQRTFQEEVRAAEQAMLEAQRQAEQGARQVLRRPEGK